MIGGFRVAFNKKATDFFSGRINNEHTEHICTCSEVLVSVKFRRRLKSSPIKGDISILGLNCLNLDSEVSNSTC